MPCCSPQELATFVVQLFKATIRSSIRLAVVMRSTAYIARQVIPLAVFTYIQDLLLQMHPFVHIQEPIHIMGIRNSLG